MAEQIITNLTLSQVTKITKSGVYQLIDETPDFLQTSYVEFDLSLLTNNTRIILPYSADYIYGKSQQIYFTTTGQPEGELPLIEVQVYQVPKGSGLTPDRLNAKINGVQSDIGSEGIFYCVQLLLPNRWISFPL